MTQFSAFQRTSTCYLPPIVQKIKMDYLFWFVHVSSLTFYNLLYSKFAFTWTKPKTGWPQWEKKQMCFLSDYISGRRDPLESLKWNCCSFQCEDSPAETGSLQLRASVNQQSHQRLDPGLHPFLASSPTSLPLPRHAQYRKLWGSTENQPEKKMWV